MQIINSEIKKRSDAALQLFFGEGAQYRDGQYEAIEATLTNKRTLVVQKTGWGKSMVYFICTKLLRDDKKGVTLIVSPLLSLMDNQIKAAEKAGLKCQVLNSTVSSEVKDEILKSMIENELDIVLTTPETLFTEKVQRAIPNINIGLFVIDEAHCISDWGHDFRLKYCKLNRIILSMMTNVPILATTATANNRVVADLKEQLGDNVYVSRGPLMRKSLSIQVLKLEDRAARYAWLLENINKLPGSGIIYCLTRDDCDYLADYLNTNGIDAMSYHSGLAQEQNSQTERLFADNQIKVLVATVKLGMGYDKGDIAFVIHYQTPSNIVAYYQQIGRAGRSIDRAYTFLMCGQEDTEIQDYFIDTAFPAEWEADEVMERIRNSKYPPTKGNLEAMVNIPQSRLNKALMFLENEEFIYIDNHKFYPSLKKKYTYNREHYEAITAIRRKEQQQMQELINTDKCYARFAVNCLDDFTADNCGICANCLGYEEYPSSVSQEMLDKALMYLDSLVMPITPRKMWPATQVEGTRKIRHPLDEGLCLSKYGDPGYGSMVKKGKYDDKRFCDRLVEKSAEVLNDFIRDNQISAITYVPSLRSDLVKDFTERLAKQLGIPLVVILEKSGTSQQKDMENSAYQCKNAVESFSLLSGVSIPKRILLVDDIFDSKWTLTVCGNIMLENGAEHVYPFALACSSKKEGND